jgi:hypothetical protein
MSLKKQQSPVEKLETGVPGFDLIAYSGLPKYRAPGQPI